MLKAAASLLQPDGSPAHSRKEPIQSEPSLMKPRIIVSISFATATQASAPASSGEHVQSSNASSKWSEVLLLRRFAEDLGLRLLQRTVKVAWQKRGAELSERSNYA